ncbi:YIP1 family protein [Pseudothauera nasutitermitis]|uniref:YIP1 family protein n=1 Tax=Pseudothauera nasutitermitis TaxID=2565930 RepID=A0A4S4AP91_9RHOO|nr:Yip1 family protein [Pseudothauera nasutitermitis]THF61489.1 YIP1 family protein [Pseudothauera nasutitermitis]
MTLHDLPRMMVSYTEGWPELIRIHPSVRKMFLLYVMPMSLIPAAMFIYAIAVTPGAVFPALVPQIGALEMLAVALTFYLAQLAMVPLMGSIIQQMGEVVDVKPDYHDAFMLAAIAPTPLWLAALALFIPSAWVVGMVVALAWVASAALIYHGVKPLFGIQDDGKSRLLGSFVLGAGVIAWAALMVVLALLLSMIVGLR